MATSTGTQNTSPDHFVPREESHNVKLLEDILREAREELLEEESLDQNLIVGLNLLPDLVIEMIMAYLSFSDLFKLSKEGEGLKGCAMRMMKKKKFSKYIIQ